MMLAKIFLVVFWVAYLATNGESAVMKRREARPNDWNYDDRNGWRTGWDACGGKQQSPINLDPEAAIPDPEMPALTFVNYDKLFPQTISNNGHTVVLQLEKNDEDDEFPSIQDGGLNNDTYIFQQLHFHWGDVNSRGSEHRLNNKIFPAELHMVHYNSKYGNLSTAAQHDDGLAVLGIFMELGKRDNVVFRRVDNLETIKRPVGSPASTALAKPFYLEDLLPDYTGSFYRYEGSLTTPSCSEVVTWTVFDTPIALSERQLDMFRSLFNGEGQHLVDNYRDIQSLYDRVVMYRPDDRATESPLSDE